MNALYFILGFLLILGGFIYFIRWVGRQLSHKISPDRFTQIERVIIAGIVVGVVSMFQPWLFVGYKYGFLLLLFSTLAFIVWSHVTPAAVLYGEEDFVGVSAGHVAEPEATGE
ncbi:MAG: hypothetical protein R3E79_59555 [Caldilineaceae bacterium]